MAYLRYFCAKDTADVDALKENEPRRIALYKLTASLLRAFASIANELPEAMAETIENNLRRVIIDERPTNPMYYEKMSALLRKRRISL